jgi:hypothetical protein
LLSSVLLSGTAHAQAVNVTSWHYDNSLSGANTQETILTPSNVNSLTFGRLFSVPLDGMVFAQPLYLTGVSIAGGVHNVVYAVTENDSVYAIDADNGTVYEQVSLLPAGATTVSGPNDLGCNDVIPQVGITGTPVIDTSSNTLYVVAVDKNADGSFSQYLHALDVTTLSDKVTPMAITATVAGTASDGNGSTVTFNTKLAFQRPALALENKHIIIGWGSHCDDLPWHGWVMSYAAGTLAQEAVMNITPNGSGGGLWAAGSGIASDSSGNIYFPTGNGTWNGTTDFGNSILKLGPPSGGAFPVLDYFTPWNWPKLYSGNSDVSAGGLLLLPPLLSGTQLIAQDGKSGTIELLNAANLGHECSTCTSVDTNVVQELPGATSFIIGSPAYWNGNVYWGPASSSLRAYAFNASTGLLSTTPVSVASQVFSFAAPTPSISASSPTANGILWAIDGTARNSTCGSTPGVNCLGLYAYNASNLGTVLYNSSQSANDPPPTPVKFATPVVTNGKVYVGTQTGISVYGLLSHSPTAVTPLFSLAAGTYTSTQSVSLSDPTPNSTIYYTIDGSQPSPGVGTTAVYNNTPINVSTTTTINAIAIATGYVNSAVGSATYTFAMAGAPVTVSLTSSDNIYGIGNPGTAPQGGGLDGGGYAYDSALLGKTITFAGSTFTLGTAGAIDAVTSKTIALPQGSYLSVNLLATAVGGDQPAQTFTVNYSDGTTSVFTQGMSDWFTPGYAGETVVATMASRISPSGAVSPGPCYLYGYSFAVNSAKTVVSITLPSNRNVIVFAIDLIPIVGQLPTVAMPGLSPTPTGVFTGPTKVTLSDGTTGAAIYYTTDGSTPNTSSNLYGAPFTLNSTATVNAIGVLSGYNNSPVATGLYTIAASGAPVSVSLLSVDNVYGIASTESPAAGSGLDGSDYAFASSLLGTSLTWSGATFTFGPANALDAVSNKVITLPAGSFGSLSLLATGVNGNQPGQTFTVTYSDNSTQTFTQGVSDWFTPQGYAGETIVSTMAYRISPSGASSPGPCYLYGYTFALNSAKTVASITLPATGNVKVLAIDLIPASAIVPTEATPQFSPTPSVVYTAATPVTLTDSTGGTIYYTLDGSTPAPGAGTTQLYSGAALSIGSTTTINAIATGTGYNNSMVGTATYTIALGGAPVAVGLASSDNVYGIANTGSAVLNGGLDGSGYDYAAALLGTSIVWSGSTFTLAAAGVPDAVTSKTITLPAGSYGSLNMLATAVDGNQASQTFTVTYSDNSTQTFTQSLSDWFRPQNYSGETIVSTMAYRIAPSGATSPGPCYLYGYTFALNSAKTIASITLPANSNVKVFAIDLVPVSNTPTEVAPGFSPTPGVYSAAVPVTLSDTSGGTIYYTLDGSTPAPGVGTTQVYGGTPLNVAATTTINAIAAATGYNTSPMSTATYTVAVSGSPVSVSLVSADNVYGSATPGTAVGTGGIDGAGYAYSSTLLGTGLTWNGSTFSFAAANTLDAVDGKTITLPAGNFSTLNFLGTGVSGNQPNQTFTVTYSDNSTATYKQGMSDWFTPQGYAGETGVLTMATRVAPSGASSPGPCYLYGYSFALNNTKTVTSITLPSNRNAVVLAIELMP